LLELRSGLEIYVARLAAARVSASDLRAIAGSLEWMRSGIDNLNAFARADLDFHNALAAAAGNGTFVDLLHVVRSLLQVYADRAVHDGDGSQHRSRRARAVYRAIAAADEDAAASAMATHMATASRRLASEAT
jgi:GntR family transcriptional repressor for pyruvate dehydrogenase complex